MKRVKFLGYRIPILDAAIIVLAVLGCVAANVGAHMPYPYDKWLVLVGGAAGLGGSAYLVAVTIYDNKLPKENRTR